MEQYNHPRKFSSAWNFGTNPKSVTTVKKIVQFIIKFWGKGKLIAKKNSFYEQANLQLNINKAKRYLKWSPTYNIKESVKITVDWYHQVLQQKKSPSKVTDNQIKRYMHASKII
jgi:CDP-glucose 4,6-dehydratase